jgi:hypothetical protein
MTWGINIDIVLNLRGQLHTATGAIIGEETETMRGIIINDSQEREEKEKKLIMLESSFFLSKLFLQH